MDDVIEEIWKELLRCSVCRERIAVVSVKKAIGDGSIFGKAVCVRCLPKFVVQVQQEEQERVGQASLDLASIQPEPRI